MNDLIKRIKDAAENVLAGYLKLLTTRGLIVRERVFCYELYHQIRLLMTDTHPLIINGEIDKGGNQEFDRVDQKNPDFVFHLPGRMNRNTIVMEVKGKLNKQKKSIIKDFNTLNTFISDYQYKVGIFFLFNHTILELKAKMGDEFNRIKRLESADKIYIITLPIAGKVEQAELLSTIN